MWETAESQLREILTELKIPFYEAEGEAAFYGPKIDIQIKTALNHDVTIPTCQLDFALPERFELEYVGEDGEKHRPVVIHRAILGSSDRFISFLLEETKGILPLWLAPVQVEVMPLTDKQRDYAVKVTENLRREGIRVELDDRQEKIGYKIREAQLNKIPYMLILGDKEVILYGDGYIYDRLLDNQYKISLKSFYQVNPIQVEKLYQTAIDLAHINQDSVVLDAYCGIGTITLSLAKHVKKVYGVEVVPQAIEDAKNNALLNKIDNADFVCDDAGKYMVELVKKNTHLDVVFVDPPRKGCSEEFLEHLLQASPKEIIYISCDVATQARDAKYLNEHGYTITHCQPVDMFPHTFHVETVCLLSRK